MKSLWWILDVYRHYGWKGLYAIFVPVTWEQDSKMKNGGYDLIHLKKTAGYFYGTLGQRNAILARLR